MNARNPLQKALELTTGARQESYGHPSRNFTDLAAGWSVILSKHRSPAVQVTPEEVALMMIWLKVDRQAHADQYDNLVDIAGYVNCLQMIRETPKPRTGSMLAVRDISEHPAVHGPAQCSGPMPASLSIVIAPDGKLSLVFKENEGRAPGIPVEHCPWCL